MASAALLDQAKLENWSDDEIVGRILAGETALYELLMRRHNQRLYRVARAILRDDAEAEDVMQDAYVRAYRNLENFEGRSSFLTWLTRIAVNEALGRVRKRNRFESLDATDEPNGDIMRAITSTNPSPERQAYDRELSRVLEKAVLTLSEEYRLVFMLRTVEGLNTEETANCLNLTQENVKVRLHRVHAMLRKQISQALGASASNCFEFHATRCDRVVNGVFARLGFRP